MTGVTGKSCIDRTSLSTRGTSLDSTFSRVFLAPTPRKMRPVPSDPPLIRFRVLSFKVLGLRVQGE